MPACAERGYEVEVYPHPEPPPKSLIVEKVRSGIDGLITTLRDPVDAEVLAAGDGTLKCVAQYAVGVDNIDRGAADRYRIPFTNTPDVLTEATAEFALFALADLSRRLWRAEKFCRQNRWGFWHPYLPFLGDEITGKTIAIIGTGRVGQAMARKCSGFDLNILCHEPNRPRRNSSPPAGGNALAASRRPRARAHHHRVRILERCVATGGLGQHPCAAGSRGEGSNPTYHLFNETTLRMRMMKPTAYLVNTSRGAVIDEAALLRALREREKDGLPVLPWMCLKPNHCRVLERNYEGDIRKMPFLVNKEAFG